MQLVSRWSVGTAVNVAHHESLVHFFSAGSQIDFIDLPVYSPQPPMNLLLKICLRPSPRANVFYALVEAYQDAWAEQSESGTTSWASQRDMNDNVPLAFFIWLWEWVGNDGSEAASRFEQIRVGLRYCLPSYFDDLFAAIEAFAPPEDSGHNCATMLETNSGTEPKSLNLGVWANQTCFLDPEIIFGFLSQTYQDAIEGIPLKNAAVAAHTVAAALLIHAKPETWRPRPVIQSEFGKGSPEERSAVKGEDIAEFLSIFLEDNPEDDGLVWELWKISLKHFLTSMCDLSPAYGYRFFQLSPTSLHPTTSHSLTQFAKTSI
ncbi:unnamed protein product [Clonostachys chloroleuca]|uniref:Uncharacterized protein n=1 Tax=Clonostachys chloroleuca TaxID=1926264 RepID=A0AA35QCG1_9HYPO|nr:unnamed protein product [Clonostachys chloroleuca]